MFKKRFGELYEKNVLIWEKVDGTEDFLYLAKFSYFCWTFAFPEP